MAADQASAGQATAGLGVEVLVDDSRERPRTGGSLAGGRAPSPHHRGP